MPETDTSQTSTLTNRLDRTAKTYSNVKTLTVAIASAVGVIFAAGIYYNELRHKLNEYVVRLENLEAQQSSLKKQIEAQSNELSAEKTKIRSAVNTAFMQLLQIDNSGAPFTNTEPANNGGGFSPTTPPGRCAVGQVVVGVAPFKAADGIRSITMQCGTVPKVKID
jgi:hypothetical protein